MEAIPADDASFDFVWCRDVLVHVVNADKAFKECTRVLQPGSHCLVFSTFATDRMEPKEQARLFDALGIVKENMAPQRLEARMMDAGFEIKSVDSIGSELIQYYEEKDHRCSTELMRYARMTQKKERFRLLLGEEAFEAAAALYQWMVYQLLGKLSSSIYLLKKP